MTEPQLQAPAAAIGIGRFVILVVSAIALLVVLGGTVLGGAEDRATVLIACAWFTAHLVVIFVWLARARPHEPALAAYARVSTLWLLVLVAQLGVDAAPTLLLTELSWLARLWFMVASLDLILQVTGHHGAVVRRGLLALAASTLLVPVAGRLDAALAEQVFEALHLLLRVVGLAAAGALVHGLLRAPNRELQILFGTTLVIMGVGYEALWVRLFPGAMFTHLITPVIGVAMALLLVSRLLEATRAAESLAANLETKVAERTRQLEARHRDVQELERRRALQDERERLMRDMHDGAGGELVAALALLDGHGEQARTDLRERLRTALLQLRLMIDSLDELDGDLTGLLAGFRSRMQPVLDAADVTSRWHLDALPRLGHLGPRAALDVLRILQEALTNALRHAGAREVVVSAHCADGRIELEVRDDGCGFDAEAPRGGRGLANMQVRAQRLGGELRIERLSPGTRVRLSLPIDGDERPSTSAAGAARHP